MSKATLALAMMASLLALGAAGRPARSAPAERPATPQAAAARALLQPRMNVEQPGDVVTGYICLRLRPGVQPLRFADGSWTLQRLVAEAEPIVGAPEDAALALDERDLRDAFARHRVTSIEAFAGGRFKRPDLAAKYGLDRAFIAYVADGADVLALNAEAGGPNFAALIERSELDRVGTLAVTPSDPQFNLQWGLHNTGQTGGTNDADIDAPEAWDLHTGSASTIIAILDTGVQADHPDLIGKVIPGIDTRLKGSDDTSDLHGHGTHCAGIAAARGNDNVGVCGVNWNARILAMRVTSAAGNWTGVDVAEGVIYSVDIGDADVISMSLQAVGTPMTSNLEDAVAYAYDGGALVVAASGNQGTPTVAWPARFPKCMAVGATTDFDVRWGLSSFGTEMDVVAPGVSIYGLWLGSGYTTGSIPLQSGTSMATPHVAGLAALIKSRNPALSPAQIEAVIRNTADDKGAPGWDQEYGAGRINLRAALLAATPTPCPGNTNGNGSVDVNDLLAVITGWGACPIPPGACSADVSPVGPPGDGLVNVNDLLMVITHWGPCP